MYNKNVLEFVDEECDKVGITQTLRNKFSSGIVDTGFEKLEGLSNGVILELLRFKNIQQYDSVRFGSWLSCLVVNLNIDNIAVLSTKVERLAAKKKQLIERKKKEELINFLQANFCFPTKREIVIEEQTQTQVEMERFLDESQEKIYLLLDEIDALNLKVEALNEVINDSGRMLVEEKVNDLEVELEHLKHAHDKKNTELLNLVDRLRPYSKKNVDRVLKRRDDKVKNLTDNMKLIQKQCDDIMVELNISLNDLKTDNSFMSNRVLQLSEELSRVL